MEKEYLRSELPYFPIRAKARVAAASYPGIAEESYVRVVRRIFQGPLSARQLVGFSPLEKEAMGSKILALKQRLLIHKIKLRPNKACHVLIEKLSCSTEENRISPRFYYLNYTCQDCIYFESRKKDCQFFIQVQAINERKVPRIWKERVNRQFTTKVACVFFRAIDPIILNWPASSPQQCLHCDHHLSLPLNETSEVRCECETIYKWMKSSKRKAQQVKVTLSEDHSIIHDIALLISYISKDHLLRLRKIPSLLDSHIYNPQVDPPIPQLRLQKQKQYIVIKDSDKITYNPKKDRYSLYVTDVTGEGRKYNLRTIHWIDTQRKSDLFFSILSHHPHIKFNFRQCNLVLTFENTVRILSPHSSHPQLSIQYHRKRPRISNPEVIPLYVIASVINVGKPRLTPILHNWGVEVLNRSLKGVSSAPDAEIREALLLQGVRPTLREIHMLGLVFSVLNATSQLYGLMIHQEGIIPIEFAARVLFRLKRLLFNSSKQIFRYYFTFGDSLKQQSSFEAWFFRPFAEGLREFIRKVQIPTEPMLPQPYGRMISRLVNPLFRQDTESYAAYTPFDTALNTMNRTLRSSLRLWNSKLGLGYFTIPLFSHITKDKPGLAGHLDLEEPGRIITRLILAQAIADGEITRKHFQRRFTKNHYQPYYIPWEWTVKKLRHDFVHRRIFKDIEIFYAQKWHSFPNAHRQHVIHLLECLLQCHDRHTSEDRQEFLLDNYFPLIYNPRPINREAATARSELYYLFDYCWVKWTKFSLKIKDLDFRENFLPLINEFLVQRLH